MGAYSCRFSQVQEHELLFSKYDNPCIVPLGSGSQGEGYSVLFISEKEVLNFFFLLPYICKYTS